MTGRPEAGEERNRERETPGQKANEQRAAEKLKRKMAVSSCPVKGSPVFLGPSAGPGNRYRRLMVKE